MSGRRIGQEIGRIARVQVQQRSLKVPGPKHRAYDPSGIVRVSRLLLEPEGVTGIAEDGAAVLDVHHLKHPRGKGRGDNGICFGFTSHYEAMRARMPGLEDGMAGENLLIESDRMWDIDGVSDGLVVVTASGKVWLDEVEIAPPCPEFARYALRFPENARPDQRMIDAVKFLGEGMRGFYACITGDPGRVSPGDRVHLALVDPVEGSLW